jgi:hypothetical protein
MTKQKLPTAVKTESRICFGISFFTSEEDARLYAAHIRKRGVTYNGGFMHGMPCGRDTSFDYKDDKLGPLYAVTD